MVRSNRYNPGNDKPLWDEYSRTGDVGPLMDRWGAYAWTVAWGKHYSWMRAQEIKQTAYIALWEAIKRFEPSRGAAAFKEYLIRTVSGRMLKMARDGSPDRKNWHVRFMESALSIEEQKEKYGNEPVTKRKSQRPGADIEAAEFWAIVREYLPAKQGLLVERHFRYGETLAEIGRWFGWSRQLAFWHYLQAMRRLRLAVRRRQLKLYLGGER